MNYFRAKIKIDWTKAEYLVLQNDIDMRDDLELFTFLKTRGINIICALGLDDGIEYSICTSDNLNHIKDYFIEHAEIIQINKKECLDFSKPLCTNYGQIEHLNRL